MMKANYSANQLRATQYFLGVVKVIQKFKANMKTWKMSSCSRYYGNVCSTGILM